MIKKCPHCAFEPIQDQLICPNCGVELNDTILEKIENKEVVPPIIEEMNDNIKWSNYEDVPLGSVIEHFNDTIEEESYQEALEIASESEEAEVKSNLATTNEPSQEAETTNTEALFVEKKTAEDELSDNPILAAYIRRHREGLSEEELLAAIEENQSDEENKTSKVIDEKLEEAVVVTEVGSEKSTEELQEPIVVSTTNDVIVLEKTAEAIIETNDLPKSQVSEAEKTESSMLEIDKALSLIAQHEEKSEEEKPTEQVPSEPMTAKVSEASPEAQPTTVSIDAPTNKQSVISESAKQVTPIKKNRKKIVYTLTAVGLVMIASGGWLYYDSQQKAEAARQEQLRIDAEITQARAQLLDFYLTEDQTFIKPDKTLALLKDQQKALEKYRSQAAYAEIEPIMQDLYLKLTNIESLNSYFTAPILVGDQLIKEVHIKDESPIVIDNLSGEDAFAKRFNEALQLGKIELQKVVAAKLAVESLSDLYQEEKLSDALTRKEFEAAKKQVDNLFEISTKETLQKQLAPIEVALIAREEREEAARIAAEQKAEAERLAEERRQAALQQAQNVGSEILSPNTPTNSNNQPIIRSRQSDINDVNNPAWAWAPGVYDRVVNTLISRGNIEAGSFYVVPVRIENGEGYYHLYATNKNASGNDTYLVTINAKTGYFKGNGG